MSVALIGTACGSISTPTSTPAIPTETTGETLDITDPDKPIEVSAGNEFTIVIQSNPTTGYHWELMGEPDANTVEFVSKDYKADEPVLIGSGGVDIWTFKAIGAGETTITLGSYPPANDAVEPEQTLAFVVIVK
jgi:inhibitor of cysteine peptidase